MWHLSIQDNVVLPLHITSNYMWFKRKTMQKDVPESEVTLDLDNDELAAYLVFDKRNAIRFDTPSLFQRFISWLERFGKSGSLDWYS